MSEENIENWMNALDDERTSILSGWDVDNDDGKEIVEGVAKLLEKECIYDVIDVKPIKSDGTWQILAYAGSDYDSLKDREIEFLGFKLVFKKIN
jgi:hypothetical protein